MNDTATLTKVAAIAVGKPTFDVQLAQANVQAAFELLGEMVPQLSGRAEMVTEPHDVEAIVGSSSPVDVAVLIQATFTDARFAAALAGWAGRVIVWSFPEQPTGGRLRLNSLCGAILAANQLAIDHVHASFVHGAPGPQAQPQLAAALAGAPADRPAINSAPQVTEGEASVAARRVVAALRAASVGVVGDGPDGFGPCEVVERFGDVDLRPDRRQLDELFAAADAVSADELEAARNVVAARLDGLDQMPASETEPSLRLYGALGAMVAQRGWSAVATRCWPECFTDRGGAICSPLGMLADDGVPGACEADMLGATTMLALGQLAGTPAVLLDLVAVDTDADWAVLWHCGVAPTSTADPDQPALAGRHPNRELALTHQFSMRPGRITLARFSNSRGVDRLVYATGEVLASPPAFRGTSATVRFDHGAGDVLSTVLAEGLDHHLALVYGEFADELEALAAELGVSVVRL